MEQWGSHEGFRIDINTSVPFSGVLAVDSSNSHVCTEGIAECRVLTFQACFHCVMEGDTNVHS